MQGYSATAAGAAFLPFILVMFLVSRWAGGLVGKLGARIPLMIGPTIAAFGLALFAVPGVGGSYWTTFFPAMTIMGFGMAVSVTPLTTAVMNSVTVRQSGVASGINNAASRTAGVLAIAIFGVLALWAFNGELDRKLESLDVPEEARVALDAQRSKLGGAEPPAGLSPQLSKAVEASIDDAFVAAFRMIMLIAAGLALASALSAALMIDVDQRESQGDNS